MHNTVMHDQNPLFEYYTNMVIEYSYESNIVVKISSTYKQSLRQSQGDYV